MIICDSCDMEYSDIRKLSLEENQLYSVMKFGMVNKNYYCNKECYDKISFIYRYRHISKPYIDKNGFIMVNNHRKQDRQKQRLKYRLQKSSDHTISTDD
jgi:hypothetical protein